MTKLCCFNQDNTHFSMFEHHAELDASEQIHWEECLTPNYPDLNPFDYRVWGAILEKYHKVQSTPAEA